MKGTFFKWVSRLAPPDRVSLVRYRIGLVMFFASLFVLDGDFWDKRRSLFVHEAKARFPECTD